MNNTRIMLHCLFSAAWADRNLDEQERTLLQDRVATLEISEALRSDVAAWYQSPPAEPEWATQLTVEDTETMMRWILEIVTIDSTFCVQEYRFVNKIRDFIGMTSKDYYRIQGEVEDICRRRLMAANSLS